VTAHMAAFTALADKRWIVIGNKIIAFKNF